MWYSFHRAAWGEPQHVLWLLLIPVTVVLTCVFIGSKPLFIPRWVQSVGRPGWLVGCSMAVAIPIGAWQGATHRENLDAWMGKPVTILANIVSLHAIQHGVSMQIAIRSLQVSSVGEPVEWQGVEAKALWLVWGNGPSVAVGDMVELDGTLSFPPITDSKGVPLRNPLQKFGIRYEWKGRVMQLRPSGAHWLNALHQSIVQDMYQTDPMHRSLQPLMDSVVFGGATVDKTVNQAFLQAGLLHVLAASGANVVLMIRVIEALLWPAHRWLRMPAWIWTTCILLFIWLFCGLCGASPSIVRASMMSSYQQLGRAFGRRPSVIDALVMGFCFEQWAIPGAMSGVSSVLSFVATAAVAVTIYTLRSRRHADSVWSKWVGHFAQTLRITVVVELALLPLTVFYFGQVTPYSVLSNLVAEPLLAVLLPVMAFYVMTCAMVHSLGAMHWLSFVVGDLAVLPLNGLVDWAKTVSRWKGSLFMMNPWPVWGIVLYYTLLILPLVRIDRKSLWTVWYTGYSSWTDKRIVRNQGPRKDENDGLETGDG